MSATDGSACVSADGSRPRLSIVIPSLNDCEPLGRLLGELQTQQGLDLEVLVGDGGSRDATRDVCLSHGALWLSAPQGRGRQMNVAASRASSELLLFLHADSTLPDRRFLARAVAALGDALDNSAGPVAGHFALRFRRRAHADRHAFAYRCMEEKSRLNRPDTINGDQGLLICRSFFNDLGGFDESQPFLEDQRIARQIFERGRWILLPGVLSTSARRFEADGFFRVSVLMALIMVCHRAGISRFFELAPAIYQRRSVGERLYLAPYFQLTWALPLRHLTLRQSLAGWYRAGSYVRESLWLFFYWIDQLLQPFYGRRALPLLKFHDRLVQPLLNNVLGNLIATALSFFWFSCVLFAFFYITEKREWSRRSIRGRCKQSSPGSH